MIKRYQTKVSLYNEQVEELNKVTQQHDDIKRRYDEWRKKRHAYLSLFFLSDLCSFNSSTQFFFFLVFTELDMVQ